MKSWGRSEGTLGGPGRGCLLRLGALVGKLLSKGPNPRLSFLSENPRLRAAFPAAGV